jgi:hypothetical protein
VAQRREGAKARCPGRFDDRRGAGFYDFFIH